MESIIQVENIKCAGCMNTIETKLMGKEGVNSLEINQKDGLIKLQHEDAMDISAISKLLTSLGYPPSGENSLGAKTKSYVSCMIGRVS